MSLRDKSKEFSTTKTLRGLFAMLVVSFLAGCASQHQQFVQFPNQTTRLDDNEKGRIYVIRKPWSINWASHVAVVQIYDGDQEIGRIAGHRGYLCWERDPGLVTIKAASFGSFPEASIEQEVVKGGVHYILQGLRPESTCLGIPLTESMMLTLQVVDEETGKKELKNCYPPSAEKKGDSEPKDRPASERPQD